MNTLSSELKATIGRHLEAATPRELATIVGTLCGEQQIATSIIGSIEELRTGPRFEIAGYFVRDHETGLEWTRGNVAEKRLEWKEANAACEKLELAGGAWRMPTIKELLTLVDYERHDPASDPAFTCESAWYWSSTPYAPSPGGCAWGVYFGLGGAGYVGRGYDGFVRAVRGGQF